ncbi:MAG: acyl-CoA dehydratase activase, partial [bacterium]|nr:acyl-CoA dehydratase activase [bacterium]
VDEHGKTVCHKVADTGVHAARSAEAVLRFCLEKENLAPSSLARVVSTGYGKQKVAAASVSVTEITCHALGVFNLFPDTRTVIDIGGQDSKVILLDGAGGVVDFAMNDRCAAGTGRFLEVMARHLELDLAAMGSIGFDPARAAAINSLCTVFAESEVVSLLAEGQSVGHIVRGLHGSVAERTAGLLKRITYGRPVTMTGGVAKNRGVVEALEHRLDAPLNLPAEPQVVGALGAALVALKQGLPNPQGT